MIYETISPIKIRKHSFIFCSFSCPHKGTNFLFWGPGFLQEVIMIFKRSLIEMWVSEFPWDFLCSLCSRKITISFSLYKASSYCLERNSVFDNSFDLSLPLKSCKSVCNKGIVPLLKTENIIWEKKVAQKYRRVFGHGKAWI